jgi:hypothetical protein
MTLNVSLNVMTTGQHKFRIFKFSTEINTNNIMNAKNRKTLSPFNVLQDSDIQTIKDRYKTRQLTLKKVSYKV